MNVGFVNVAFLQPRGASVGRVARGRVFRNGPARAGSGPTVPTMDGREFLAAYQDRLQDVRDRTARARRALAAVAGTATSRDGAVVITVDQAGALQRLQFTEHAEVLSRAELAATVLDTARRARAEAARQAEAALVPVLGERSEAMQVVRSHLTPPER